MSSQKFEENQPFATCFGRTDGVRFIQGSNAFNGAKEFVGTVNDLQELTPAKAKPGPKPKAVEAVEVPPAPQVAKAAPKKDSVDSDGEEG